MYGLQRAQLTNRAPLDHRQRAVIAQCLQLRVFLHNRNKVRCVPGIQRMQVLQLRRPHQGHEVNQRIVRLIRTYVKVR